MGWGGEGGKSFETMMTYTYPNTGVLTERRKQGPFPQVAAPSSPGVACRTVARGPRHRSAVGEPLAGPAHQPHSQVKTQGQSQQMTCLSSQSCLWAGRGWGQIVPLSRLYLGHRTLEMGTVRRRGGRIWKREEGKASLHCTTHTLRERERARTKLKPRTWPKRKIYPVPSKLILGQEIIAKDPNKKPTTACKRLQVFN